MTMDNTEIINTYRAAKDKKAQLGILAELNTCSKTEIADILTAAGEKVDGRWYTPKVPRQKKPAAAPVQQKTPDAAPAQQDKPMPPAPTKDGKALILTRTELLALREYMDETLVGYIHSKTECANANLGKLNALTGVWLRLTGGKV